MKIFSLFYAEIGADWSLVSQGVEESVSRLQSQDEVETEDANSSLHFTTSWIMVTAEAMPFTSEADATPLKTL